MTKAMFQFAVDQGQLTDNRRLRDRPAGLPTLSVGSDKAR
jgi:hypothetical protein